MKYTEITFTITPDSETARDLVSALSGDCGVDSLEERNAQHNGEINGVEMEIFEGDKQVLSHVSGLFDLILANINRNVLLADMDSFVEVLAHDGSLILSGFYEMDIPLLEEAATRQGLVVSRVSARGDWRCLLLQRPSAQG